MFRRRQRQPRPQPQPAGGDDGLSPFVVRYRHQGADCALEIRARDAADARARLAGLAEARLAVDEDAARASHPLAAVAHFIHAGLGRLFAVHF